MIFQITGYPRSGTAWLTTMFNLAPEVMAYHELAMRTEVWKSQLSHVQDRGLIAGDVGTYQYLQKAVIPDAKKVFIQRNPVESELQCRKATGIHNCMENIRFLESKANNWIDEWDPLVVEFVDLFKLETLEMIWIYCTPGTKIEFPDERVEQLLKFNIQLHEPAKALSAPGAIERLAELL